MALLLSFNPLTIVHLTAGPHILALTVDFSVFVLALVNVVIAEALVPEAMPFVVGPFTFVYSTIVVCDYATAHTLLILDFTAVE